MTIYTITITTTIKRTFVTTAPEIELPLALLSPDFVSAYVVKGKAKVGAFLTAEDIMKLFGE